VGRADDEVVEAKLRIELHRMRYPARAVTRGAAVGAPALRRLSTSSEMARSGGELRDAAEVERVGERAAVEDQLARQILLVVLEHERHGAGVDALVAEVGV